MAAKPLNASLLPAEFVSNEAEELLKWQRAQNFTLTNHGGQVRTTPFFRALFSLEKLTNSQDRLETDIMST